MCFLSCCVMIFVKERKVRAFADPIQQSSLYLQSNHLSQAQHACSFDVSTAYRDKERKAGVLHVIK